MSFYSGLSGEASELAREHQNVLDRLPRTFLVSIVLELERWSVLFEPEKAYFRVLLKQLAGLTSSEFEKLFGGLTSLESDAGCNRVVMDDPKTLQERTQTLLRKEGLLSRWREEIDDIFQKLQLPLEAQLYSKDTGHRLIVIIYGQGIAIERDKLWRKFSEVG